MIPIYIRREPTTDFAIGVNPSFLIDAIKATAGDEYAFRMSFTTPKKPIVCEAGGFKVVTMPINLA